MSKDRAPFPLNHDETDAGSLLAGYPGAALLIGAGGTVIAVNRKGASIKALLQQGEATGIQDLIGQAASKSTLTVGTVKLPGSKGEVVLEVTAAPQADKDVLLVLARDMTMERNLRSALVESRQRFKDLVDVSSDFAWEIGADATFVFVSLRGALGFRSEELIGRRPEEFVLDAEEYSPLPFVSDHPLEEVEMWMRRVDGATACVIVSCLPLKTEAGEWRGTRGICKDVTEEREREAALARARHREQLLNYIVSTIRDEIEPYNMLTAAAAATARALGAAGCRIYRLSEPGEFTVAAEYGNADGLETLDKHLGKLDSAGNEESKALSLECRIGKWLILATATHYRQSVNGTICMWKEEDPDGWDDDNRILIGDVANQLGIASEQIANHERIVKLSRTDSLTGLLNRRAFFEEELPRRLARLERSRLGASLFYVDMDNFKRVNDVHGHQRGDEAILFLREMLIQHSRPGDVIARLGGDEFAMWLDGIPPETTRGRVQMLIDSSKSLRQFSGDEDHPLGISIGVATYEPGKGESLKDLSARADAAMYEVKRDHKGGFKFAPPPGAPPDAPDDDTKGEENSS